MQAKCSTLVLCECVLAYPRRRSGRFCSMNCAWAPRGLLWMSSSCVMMSSRPPKPRSLKVMTCMWTNAASAITRGAPLLGAAESLPTDVEKRFGAFASRNVRVRSDAFHPLSTHKMRHRGRRRHRTKVLFVTPRCLRDPPCQYARHRAVALAVGRCCLIVFAGVGRLCAARRGLCSG